jgi:hypothetical protein
MTFSDEIFMMQNGQIIPLPSRSFREGHGGATLEDSLQRMLADNPDLLPGRQIAPGSEDSPRFQLLCREASVAEGKSLDHIFVDQHAIPTLLEAKLFENQDARRDVIGQILEYAASASADWGDGKLREMAAKFWRKEQGRSIDDLISERFDIAPEGIDAFWTKLELNLQSNAIRLIVAGDKIRPLVRRVLEFLNTEMENVEVYALELSCFGNGDVSIVVPTIVGQTQKSADRRERAISKREGDQAWPVDALRTQYMELATTSPLLSERLIHALDWAIEADVVDETPNKTKRSSLGILGPGGKRLFAFYEDGKVNWNVGEKFYAFPEGLPTRDRLLLEFTSQGMANELYHHTITPACRNLLRPVTELDHQEFLTLLSTMAGVCRHGEVT